MDREKIITHLKSQGTWRLVLLSIITLGIYTAHYIKRQTCIFNKYLDQDQKMSIIFVYFILLLSYVRAIMLISPVFVEQWPINENVTDLWNKIWVLLIICWAFIARRKINEFILSSSKRTQWLNRGLTFFFSVFYINYMINFINNNLDNQQKMEKVPPLPES